ncbi:helix-turn-helix domain-containing protein [Flavobacteriaceae bacterium R38]|nr:helix-turn-helix domain-containing protein [Flavobacteriaceae bacterium R38]
MNAHLKKAKKNADSTKVAYSFYLLSSINIDKYTLALQYVDSVFIYNKGKNRDLDYLLYNRKGYLYYHNFEYKKALDSYVKAKKYIDSDFQNSPRLQYSHLMNDYSIGLIMLEIGNITEALTIFKKSYNTALDYNFQKLHVEDYLRISHGLSYAYLINQKIDSAAYYNQQEIQETIVHKNLNHYNRARATEGFINYEKGNYKMALDSMLKYLPYLKKMHSDHDLTTLYLYTGKSYSKLNNWPLALKQFKKVDTIIRKAKKYTYVTRENYRILHEYYKEQGDLQNNLLYLERRIGYDSILYSNNTYLKNTIVTKYDTPKLIEEKESLIKRLENKDQVKSKILLLSITIAIVFILIAFYYYRKRNIYKKRFNNLIQKETLVQKETQNNIIKKQELSVPENIINDILEKIAVFEAKNGFLDNTLTLISLSKKFKTNSNYLSRIINYHKGKNFSKYLSDLRIAYAVKVLKEQPKLREYTIKAIAFEVGFNNVDTFTIAFYKQTKIYPSYYIKQLKKQT